MKRKLHLWLGCLGLMLATMLVATAGAVADTTDKPYKVVLPATVESGPDSTITVTYTNLTSPQTMGSANLTAPVGYSLDSVTSTSQGTASVAGNVLQLRNLNLAPNKSVTTEFKARVDCKETGTLWKSEVKQANDFNGVGNEFYYTGSNLTTKTVGECRTQETCPEDVFCEEFITYRGTLEIPATVTGGAGTLVARALAQETRTIDYFLTLASKAFITSGAPDAGVLDLAFDPSVSLECAGYTSAAPVTAIATGPVGRTKSVSMIIDQQLMTGVFNKPASALEMCMAAPQPFLTDVAYGLPGTATVRGENWFKGILPDCVGSETPAPEPNTSDLPQPMPCVYERKLDSQGNGIISAEIPLTYPDPAYRP